MTSSWKNSFFTPPAPVEEEGRAHVGLMRCWALGQGLQEGRAGCMAGTGMGITVALPAQEVMAALHSPPRTRIDAVLADEVHAQRLEQVPLLLPRNLVQRILHAGGRGREGPWARPLACLPSKSQPQCCSQRGPCC